MSASSGKLFNSSSNWVVKSRNPTDCRPALSWASRSFISSLHHPWHESSFRTVSAMPPYQEHIRTRVSQCASSILGLNLGAVTTVPRIHWGEMASMKKKPLVGVYFLAKLVDEALLVALSRMIWIDQQFSRLKNFDWSTAPERYRRRLRAQFTNSFFDEEVDGSHFLACGALSGEIYWKWRSPKCMEKYSVDSRKV